MNKLEDIANFLIDQGFNGVKSELRMYPGNEDHLAGLDEVDYKTYRIALESIKTGTELLKAAKK